MTALPGMRVPTRCGAGAATSRPPTPGPPAPAPWSPAPPCCDRTGPDGTAVRPATIGGNVPSRFFNLHSGENSAMATIIGTNGDDLIYGSQADDQIYGL